MTTNHNKPQQASNAYQQAKHRARRKAAGFSRVDIQLPAPVKANLDTLCKTWRCTQRGAIGIVVAEAVRQLNLTGKNVTG